MRILQAHSRHATEGGADHVITRERDLLLAAGHEVRQFFVLPAEESAAPAWRQAADAVWNTRATRDITAVIRDFGPDVLHVHTPFPLMSPSVFWAAHRRGVPTVSTVHSYRYSCVAGTLRRDGRICEDCVGSRIKSPAIRHRCYHDSLGGSAALALSLTVHHSVGTFTRHVDRFLTLTSFARDILVRDGIPPDHIGVKPNCVEDPGDVLPYDRRSPVVLFVGRLFEEKGIKALLEAWPLVDRAGCTLTIAGDGPLRELVERAAARDSSIRPLGWVPGETVTELQKSARMTVVPSEWYEAGPPLVLIQALACGTPVVSCDLENICSTLTETGSGLTFRTGDPVSLASAMNTMLRDGHGAQVIAKAGRALYERDHTPASTLAGLEQAYRHVTGGSRT